MADTGVKFIITEIKGEAYVRKENGEIIKLNAGDILEEGDVLLTGDGEVTLADESGAELTVPANYTLTLAATLPPELPDTAEEIPAGDEAPLPEATDAPDAPAAPQGGAPGPDGPGISDGGGSSFFNAPKTDYRQDNRFIDQGNLNRDVNEIFSFMGRHTENPRIHYRFDLDRVQFPLYGPEPDQWGGGRRDDYTPPIGQHEPDNSDLDGRFELAPDANSVKEDGPLTASGSVLANDSGKGLKVVGVMKQGDPGAPSSGNVGSEVQGEYGTVKINADGTYTYVLDNDDDRVQALAVGEKFTETFVYSATDQRGETQTTTLTITINGTNDVPVIDEKNVGKYTGELTEGQVDFDKGVDGKLPVKDVDTSDIVRVKVIGVEIEGNTPDGLESKIGKMLEFENETVIVNGENGGEIHWKFNPGDEDFKYLGEEETLELTYTVEVNDGHGGKDQKEITITIKGTNDAPTPHADVDYIKREDKTGETTLDSGDRSVLDNDEDPDNNHTLSVTKIEFKDEDEPREESKPVSEEGTPIQGKYGTLTIKADGTYTYDLDNEHEDIIDLAKGETKSDVFTYTIKDEHGEAGTGPAKLEIIIKGLLIKDANDVTEDAPDQEGYDDNKPATTIIAGNILDNDKAGSKDLELEILGVQHVDDGDSYENDVKDLLDSGVEGQGFDNEGNLVIEGNYGILKINPDGSYTYTLDNEEVDELADNDDPLTETFVYTARDTEDPPDEDSTTLIIKIYGANDDPEITVKVDDSYREEFTEGNAGLQTVGTLSIKDVDKTNTVKVSVKEVEITGHDLPEGLDSEEIKGMLTFVSETVLGDNETENDHGIKWKFDSGGQAFDFLPKGGELTLTYTIEADDGRGGKATHPVIITIKGTNDIPEAADDTNSVIDGEVTEVTANVIDGRVIGDERVGQDTDADHGDKLTLIKIKPYDSEDDPADVASGSTNQNSPTVVTGTYGTLKIGADGSYTYTLHDDEVVKAIPEGEKVNDVFTYTITDDNGETATAKLTIDVTGKDDLGSLGSGFEIEVLEDLLGEGDADKVKGNVFENSPGFLEDPDVGENQIVEITGFTINGHEYPVSEGVVTINGVGTFELKSDGNYEFVPKDHYSGSLDVTYHGTSGGKPIDDAVLKILVKAVTDPVTLSWDSDKLEGIGEEDNVITGIGGTKVVDANTLNLVVNEDKAVDLSKLMTAAFNDHDGSEDRWLVIHNTTGNKFYVGETLLEPGAKLKIDAPNMDKSPSALPEISIKGDDNFSGNLNGIKIYLVGQDYQDGVNLGNDTDPNANLFAHQGEGHAESEISEVTLNIEVKPVADAPEVGVEEDEIRTPEDTAIALGLKAPVITDSVQYESDDGHIDYPERLGEITLSEIPEGAKLFYQDGDQWKELNFDENGKVDIILSEQNYHTSDASGVELTKDQFESLKVLPPAHSSEDFTIKVEVTSYEVGDNGAVLPGVSGADSFATVNVEVTPVAESFKWDADNQKWITQDTDGDGKPDLTMTPGHNFVVHVDQDSPVKLTEEREDGFKFSTGWENQDTDEDVFAILTPTIWDNDKGEFVDAYGSTFKWKENGKEKTFTYTEDSGPVEIPEDAFDTIEYTPPFAASGTIRIEVQAKTVDPDYEGTAESSVAVSGLSYIAIHVDPKAGEVEIKNIEITEDYQKLKLSDIIHLIDNDTSELITEIKIENIKEGWVIKDENGLAVELDEGNFTWTGEAHDILEKYTIIPPPHSSADWENIAITVKTKDTGYFVEVNKFGEILLDDQENVQVTPDYTDDETIGGTVTITVTPVAERITDDSDDPYYDTDGDGKPDLIMTGGHVFNLTGEEDVDKFNLFDEHFNLKTDDIGKSKWVNQDAKETGNYGSEKTYAILTPEIWDGEKFINATNGSVFTWTDNEGTKTATYNGGRLDVKIETQYLDTVTFTPPKNAAGEFQIKVEAYTVDYDEDHPYDDAYAKDAISGEALLTGIFVEPVADPVTVAVAQAKVDEDGDIKLSITPSSDDSNETFNVTILKDDNIQSGMKFTYDNTEFDPAINGEFTTGNGYKVEITDLGIKFIDYQPGKLSVTPPEHCDRDFTLQIKTDVVDTVEYQTGGDTDTRYWEGDPLSLLVQIESKAQGAELELIDNHTVSQGTEIALSDVIAGLTMTDLDGSEKPSLVIELAEDFKLTGDNVTFLGSGKWSIAIPLGEGTITEETLKDALSVGLDGAKLIAPNNFSGKIDIKVDALTTEEKDGDTNPDASETASIYVTPTLNNSSSALEDETQNLNFDHNGDVGDWHREVLIKVSDLQDKKITLYKNGVELESDDAVSEGGSLWYKFTEAELDTISARGPANVADDYEFDVKYIVKYQGNDDIKTETPGKYLLQIFPVTDEINLSHDLDNGTNTELDADTITASYNPDSGATVFTAKISVAQSGTQNGVANPDDELETDGSEKLLYVTIDGVPAGMKITYQHNGETKEAIFKGIDDGANYTGSWEIPGEAFEGGQFNKATLENTLTFELDNSAGVFQNSDDYTITVTAYSQDEGAELIVNDSVSWNLEIEEYKGEEGTALIIQSVAATVKNFTGTEDVPISLKDLVDFKIEYENDLGDNVFRSAKFTISISGLPEGTTVDGMKFNEETGAWEATYQGGQTELEELVDTITVHLPQNWNSNQGNLNLEATISADGVSDDIGSSGITINPITDEATIAIDFVGAAEVDEHQGEEDEGIEFTVEISNDADGDYATIVGSNLYLKLTGDVGGDLYHNGTKLILVDESQVDDLEPGYYVIPDVNLGDSVSLKYIPEAYKAGEVKVEAFVVSKEGVKDESFGETDSVLSSSGEKIITVNPISSGYNFEKADGEDISGGKVVMEAKPEDNDNESDAFKIELPKITGKLVDTDGSEEVVSATLSKVPEGFIVYYSDNEGAAKMASNTGGDENGYTWGIPLLKNGELPEISVKPPEHWSGKAELSLDVWSGEKGLPPTSTPQIIELTVDPVADGITINPTQTFGNAGTLIPINLNATMLDTDGSETVTLKITGLGADAEFFAGTKHIVNGLEGYSVDYSDDTYTISGITHEEIRDLYLVQDAMNTKEITVEAFTVDKATGLEDSTSETVAGKFDLTINAAGGTSGNDTMLYYEGEEIDGKDGKDTLLLGYEKGINFAEEISDGKTAADFIQNFEIFDLTGNGAQSLDNLSAEHVLAMSGDNGTLTIKGDGEDTVQLDGGWSQNPFDDSFNMYENDGAKLIISNDVKVYDSSGQIQGLDSGGAATMSTMGAFGFDPEEGEYEGQGSSSAGYEPFPEAGDYDPFPHSEAGDSADSGSGSSSGDYDPFPSSGEGDSAGYDSGSGSASPSSYDDGSTSGSDWNSSSGDDANDTGFEPEGHSGMGDSGSGSDVIPLGAEGDMPSDGYDGPDSGSDSTGQGGLDEALEGLSADDVFDMGSDDLPLPGGDGDDGLGVVPEGDYVDSGEYFAPDVPDSAAQIADEMEEALSA